MNSKELIEKKNDLINRAEETLNKVKEEKREMTDEEMAELTEIRDNVQRISRSLDLYDDFDKMDKKPKEEATPVKNDVIKSREELAKEKELNEVRAFENYVRGMVVHERTGELTPSATSGGALIPTTIANRIIKKVYDISPLLEKSTKYNIKGALDLPYYDTTSTTITVAYQSEFTALTSSSGKFASIQLTGYLAGALTKISRSLINNAQFDIVSFIVDEMAYSISRFIEGELINGTTGKVTGLSTLTNSMTAASSTALTADEIIQLKDKIKDVYQNDAIFIMSPATRTALRLLKDSNGRYLLQDDITSPFGTTLLGKPVYVSDNMPNIATGNTVIFYGDMRGLATKFNEDINIEVLREKYADEHAIGVISWFEFDAKVEDAQKIVKLVMA